MKIEIIKDWVGDSVIVNINGKDSTRIPTGENLVSEVAEGIHKIVEILAPEGTEIIVRHG